MYEQQFQLFAGDTPLKLSSWDRDFYQEWSHVLDLPFFENYGDFANFGNSVNIWGGIWAFISAWLFFILLFIKIIGVVHG
jgi:hypothetical protein